MAVLNIQRQSLRRNPWYIEEAETRRGEGAGDGRRRDPDKNAG